MELLILVAAGAIAGAMNAVAGGGTFLTLPALIAAGVPPVLANASSTVALFPAALSSVWAYRKQLRPIGPVSLRALVGVSIAGGLAGALLLLFTPGAVFDKVLPWLLLLAAMMILSGGKLRAWLAARGHRIGPRTTLTGQFIVAIYGGYFGGAVGLITMALWALLSELDFQAAAPARLATVAAANAAAVTCFIVAGAVWWPQAIAVLAGGVIGGYWGAKAGGRLPAGVVRIAVIAVTWVTTAVFFWRGYGPN
ncbi:sulfite exporter TauE/SafE family protein [Phenylobacterium sp.]|uniref:sulfite exporter TauE/SafE family protein n=1 Tax=Phenylobacterium sp. TaxID=1871053 RepID=UPI0027327603|nr:sulfite exporter TauE/SafE family protein [Phenylobacterium sp.]MDP3660433.1 sulfite exporter TauE/SafE family protein [Phenylobacterium sp.]